MDGDDLLKFLTEWYTAHGDWEGSSVVKLQTLCNPGWSLDVPISDTELEGITTPWQKDEASDDDWVYWRSTGEVFEARCGPGNLADALSAFKEFAQHGK